MDAVQAQILRYALEDYHEGNKDSSVPLLVQFAELALMEYDEEAVFG